MSDIAAALVAAFPLKGASLSGTLVLLRDEKTGSAPSRPATWLELAERINEVDFEPPRELQPGDFRYYLPGLLLGDLCYLADTGNPVADCALEDLFWNYYDSWWHQRFIDRWCHFTPAQYDAVEEAVSLLFPDPAPGSPTSAAVRSVLGISYLERARRTLELVRLHVAIEAI